MPVAQRRVDLERAADARGVELLRHGAARGVVADAADQVDGRAGAREPDREVRGGPAAAVRDPRRRVAAVGDRPGERHDDVGHDVARDDDRHAAAAAAIRAASTALRRTSATLASSVAPPVSRWKRSSRNGVVAPPRMPCSAAAASASASTRSCSSGIDLLGLGQRVGDDDRAVAEARAAACAAITAATSSGVSTRAGTGKPESVR